MCFAQALHPELPVDLRECDLHPPHRLPSCQALQVGEHRQASHVDGHIRLQCIPWYTL